MFAEVKTGTLIAWSDSCSGQNKNFQLICFWQYLIKKKRFHSIQHKFPEPGHSFLDSDRDFGKVEKLVKARENVYSVDEYQQIMMKSTRKNQPTVTRMGDKMLNITSLDKAVGSFKKKQKILMGRKLTFVTKSGGSRCQCLENTKYKHSLDAAEPWKNVDLVNKKITINTCPDLETEGAVKIPIKKAKLDDIKKTN